MTRAAHTFYVLTGMLLMSLAVGAQQRISRVYTLRDGMPSTVAGWAYQDKLGYLWVSTPSGIAQFDGRQFVTFGTQDGLPSMNISKVLEDDSDRLWVSTISGTAQFKGNHFETYPSSDGLTNLYTTTVIQTRDKQIWELTSKGAYAFTGRMWQKIHLYPGYENMPVRGVGELNGELYVAYPYEVVCRRRNGSWIHIAYIDKDKNIFNQVMEENGEVWVTEGANTYRIDKYKLAPVIPVERGNAYSSTWLDRKNELWVSHHDTLLMMSGDHWKTRQIECRARSFFGFISGDSEGDIWTSSTSGLIQIKDLSFSVLDKPGTPLIDGIYNLIPAPGGGMLLSSGTGGGIMLSHHNKLSKLDAAPGADTKKYAIDPVDCYAFAGNGIWITTRFRKLLWFDGKKLTDYSYRLKLKTNESLYNLCFDGQREKLFVCADSTLLYSSAKDKNGTFSIFLPKNTGVPLVKPTRIFKLANGLLIVYIDDAGLFCIDKNDSLVPLIKQAGFSGKNRGAQIPVTFYQDNKANLWIAVPGLGLLQYEFSSDGLPKLANQYSIADGLQGVNIAAMTSDHQNRLWAASNGGVDILQKQAGKKWKIFNYVRSGDLNINIAEILRMATAPDGHVWLSSPDKVFIFNPDSVSLQKPVLHTVIEKVSLQFRETDWSKLTPMLYSYYQLPVDPVLRHDQNSLNISFNAVEIAVSNSNPQYSYRLFPTDTAWTPPSKVRSVSFTELAAGKYQFQVRAKDGASGWSKAAVFRFSIIPPFWETWWFRLAVILISTAIIITIFVTQIKKIETDARLKNQMRDLEMKALKAQMNPHFIYNALNSIQALVESNKRDEGIHYIGSFSRLLRQVLENSESNMVSLDRELETIDLYIQLESLRLDADFNYRKIIAPDIVPEFEKIPPLILQPFVENALWHGLSRKQGEKNITITVDLLNDDWLSCTVTDNGLGRAKAEEWKSRSTVIHRSRGIEISTKRLADFNNDPAVPIEFIDLFDDHQNPAGTAVVLRIKRRRQSVR